MRLQVITSLMVISNEPSCLEWRHQALAGLKFPDHANHVAQIWVSLAPLLQPDLPAKLADLDGTDVSPDMEERLKAGKHLLKGVRHLLSCLSRLSLVRARWQFLSPRAQMTKKVCVSSVSEFGKNVGK